MPPPRIAHAYHASPPDPFHNYITPASALETVGVVVFPSVYAYPTRALTSRSAVSILSFRKKVRASRIE